MTCDSKNTFTSAAVNNLVPELLTKWPDAYEPRTGGANEWFWRHEWANHGNCSEPLFNMKQYFELALYAKDLDGFTTNNIRPGDTPLSTTPSFNRALKTPSNIIPFVKCMRGQFNPYVLYFRSCIIVLTLHRNKSLIVRIVWLGELITDARALVVLLRAVPFA